MSSAGPVTPDILRAYELCLATYNPRLMPDGAKPFHHNSGEVAGLLFLEPGAWLWRAWRGTDNIFDWLRDAEFRPDSTGVHSGVSAHYSSALPSMIDALQTFPPGVPIRDTGHSLGGALAELSWADTVDGLAPITFCTMRLFTRARAASLTRIGIRIVNERDIVPHYPGRLGLWDYAHRPPAMRFCGDSFDPLTAHSLERTMGPALRGQWPLEGPLDIN